MRFWDSSAIIPLLIEEAASRSQYELLRSHAQVAVWWGTEIECVSALERKLREPRREPGRYRAAIGRLSDMMSFWLEIPPSTLLRREARRLLSRHSLRAADAFQLAAAIVAASGQPEDLPFVCLDQRLAETAALEGFPIHPNEYS